MVDSWETAGSFLGAGGTEKIDTGFHVSGNVPAKLRVDIAYAEFEGGARMGDGADCTYRKLAPLRSKTLAAYREILVKYQTGASRQEVDRFLAKQPGLAWLKIARQQEGFDYMIEQVGRPRTLN